MNLAYKKRWQKIMMLLVFVLSVCLSEVSEVSAENTNQPEASVLVVYSSPSGELDDQERVLDMLIGHFTSNITFKSTSDVKLEDVTSVSHLFYYGEKKEPLPPSFLNVIKNFSGVFFALGYNVEQLGERFSFVKPQDEGIFSKISIVSNAGKEASIFPHSLMKVKTSTDSEILIKASHGPKNEYPLMIKNKENYYYSALTIDPILSIFLAEILHDVFKQEHENVHKGYIRLEDVHPRVDAKNVMEIAKVLKERNIPYMVAVIPVYLDPETNKEYHLEDNAQLIKALKYIQDNGGSIVLHGYTHQFRTSETGEGFEFWDVENNMPIYHSANEKVVKKTVIDFDSVQAFEQYRKEQIEYETNYVKDKLNKGIQELANYGIYPLAFEAPHYTMSQNGYRVTSDFFSTYVGQIQTSDKDWRIMGTTPYITKPSFLNGMVLLPETIGYVEPNDRKAIEKIIKNAKDFSIVRDGMIAGFYHPYLGVERFIELLDELEKIPNIDWIDLKKMDNTVHTEHVEIKTIDGDMTVDTEGLFTLNKDFILFHVKQFVAHLTWGMVGAGAIAVLLFIVYTIFVSLRRNRYG